MSGQSGGYISCTTFSQPTVVPDDASTDQRAELCVAQIRQHTLSSGNSQTPQTQENEARGISVIRECLISAGLPVQTADIIMQSWRPSTRKQYGSYFQRWVRFCHQRQIDKINPSLGEIMTFLTLLHDDGLSYSAINSAKSMLSAIFQIIHKRDIGNEILIKRFMKGIFHIKPAIPRTCFTWDVQTVLRFLGSLENDKLTLRLLSVKLAVLLVITTGQRCQTLRAMDIKNMDITQNYVKIRIGDLLKQTSSKTHLPEIFIEAFKPNPSICVVTALNHYISKTASIRTDSRLFIITQKPYSGASKDTIAKWIKLGLKLAGIDLTLFTPHSTRSASTSALVNKVPLDTIIKTAGWARECTFRKFYRKPVTNDSTFSNALLSG